MVRKRIAAVVALSLVGVVPAGLAWADPKGDPDHPGCRNGEGSNAEKNPHCHGGQTPSERGATGAPSQTRPADPVFAVDTYNLQGAGLSGREVPARVQAIEVEGDGDDFKDGGKVLVVTTPVATAEVTESAVHVDIEGREVAIPLQRP